MPVVVSPSSVPVYAGPVIVESETGIADLLRLINYIDVFYNSDDQNSSSIGNLHTLLTTSGFIPAQTESASEFFKYLKALSYAFYDVDKVIEDLAGLVDINECPPEFLEYLANLVGWTFVGGDVESWRAQLRQAVYIYKTKGTKQSLIDALGYVFPQPLTTFSPASSVKECYESYFPFLLYYILKTASPICQNKSTLIEFLKAGQQTTDLVYNIDSYDHDKNIRFAVDAILEELDREFKCIEINGVHYKETDTFNNQTEAVTNWIKNGQRVTGKGYKARGNFVAAIPPWEHDRFYATSHLTAELLDYLKKILTGCDEGNRFHIPSADVDALIDYIKNRTGIQNESDPFYFGYNHTFKFFTSALEIPFNKPQIIASGNDQQLAALDYWNSKSSHIFVVLDVNSFDSSTLSANAITSGNISNISYTLNEFLPFHALPRIIIKVSITDDYYGYVESVFLSLVRSFDEANTNLLASYETSGWLGTSGIGNFYSAVDPTYSKLTGRFLPKPTTSFWGVFSGGGLINIPRKATRRRNWRYEVVGDGYSMDGRNNPTSHYFYGSGLSALERSPEYIPLGYNFSGQHFTPLSSISLSGVYDTSNAPIIQNGQIVANSPSAVYMGIPVSATMLFMGIADLIDDFTVLSPRQTLTYGKFYRMIVDRLLRKGKDDMALLRFDADDIEDVSFGDLHELWADYRTVFEYNLDGSGFHALNHAFGPLIYNADFEVSGQAGNANTSSLLAYRDGRATLLDSREYSYIYGADNINDGHAYRTHDGQLANPTRDGIVWSKGWNSYKSEVDEFENSPLYTQRSQLSGIEVVAKDSTNSLIVADFSSVPLDECHQAQDYDIRGITFFGGKDDIHASEQIKIRLPLIRNKNLIPNSKWINPQTNPNLLSNPEFSATSDWKFVNTPRIYSLSGSAQIPNEVTSPDEYNVILFVGNSISLSSFNGQHIKTSNIKNLLPTDSYQLSYEVSCHSISGNIGVEIYNNDKQKYYSFITNTWTNSPSGMFTGSLSADSAWRSVIHNGITIDRTFSIEDSYSVFFGINASGSNKYSIFKNPFLRKENENTLLPNREYSMLLNIDSSSFSGVTQSGPNKVQIRILTGKRNYKGEYTKSDRFIFSHKRNRWMLLSKDNYKDFNVVYDLNDGLNQINLNFHTLNQYGPIDSKRNLLTLPQYLNVHTADTYYYIEITPVLDYRDLPLDLYRPSVRLINISIKDTKYKEVEAEYIKEEARLILNMFSGMKDSYHTKNSVTSEGFDFGVSGGSRNIYLEQFGGTRLGSTL